MPAGHLGERVRVGSGYGSGGGAEAFVGAAELEVFRQGDEAGTTGSGLGRERRAVVMLASTSSVASSWTRATGRRMPAS